MSDKPNNPGKSDKDNKNEESNDMDQNMRLLMRIIKVNQGLAVRNWDQIAEEEGLTTATAK